MTAERSVFGAMLQEFEVAARILNLDPGIWKILTKPKRQIIVSCPVQMDNGADRGLHRLPRAIQHHARSGQGRHPLSPRRHARRSHRAGGVDDVEMRGCAHPVRRRQGRRHLRSHQDVAARNRGADAALHSGNHRRHRSREGRARAGREHQRADHGLVHGHLFHARRPHRNRRRDRQTGRDGRIARPPRGDRPRRDDHRARGGEASRLRAQRRQRCRSGLRQRRLDRRRTARRKWAPRSSA